MGVVTRCQVTELLVDQCAHCRCPDKPTPPDPFGSPAEVPDKSPWRGLGPWFTSLYGGLCHGCRERFYEGDQIRADGDGGYLAECCGGES